MIRMATLADIPQMLQIYTPYVENTTYSFEYAPPTQEQFSQRFSNYTKQCPWLVWEEDGQVLGYAYGSLPFTRSAYAWCVEVSIYLHPSIHGKGIGRKLYAVLEEILWKQGYRRIYSLITEENTGSILFHEKVGYHFCAELPHCGFKFGRWLSVIWLEKVSDCVDAPSSPPIPWTDIVKSDRNLSDILASLPLS